jgi:hypothetical protein
MKYNILYKLKMIIIINWLIVIIKKNGININEEWYKIIIKSLIA